MAANLVLKRICVGGWGKMAPQQGKVECPSTGLGKGILNWIGKLRLGNSS